METVPPAASSTSCRFWGAMMISLPRWIDTGSGEDDGLPAVSDDAVLRMPQHGARQHLALDIGSATLQVGGGVGVGRAGDVLLDDRPLVQVLGHVVGRRADQLHTALLGLLIRRCSDEGRQERVMDVDD